MSFRKYVAPYDNSPVTCIRFFKIAFKNRDMHVIAQPHKLFILAMPRVETRESENDK